MARNAGIADDRGKAVDVIRLYFRIRTGAEGCFDLECRSARPKYRKASWLVIKMRLRLRNSGYPLEYLLVKILPTDPNRRWR